MSVNSDAISTTSPIPIVGANTLAVIPVSVLEDDETLARAIRSVLPFTPNFHLWENRPPGWAGREGAEALPEWPGFGPGRTAALRDALDYAEDGIEWLLLLDADDELVVGDDHSLLTVPLGEPGDVYALQLRHGELRYYQPRIFHRTVFDDPANQYLGRTHEWWGGPVTANIRPGYLAYRVNPDGVRRRTGAKLVEDFEALKADFADGSVDYRRCRFYLAQTLAEMGRVGDAYAGYMEAVGDPQEFPEYRFMAAWRALLLIADTDTTANRPMLLALMSRLCPLRPEPHWYVARHLGDTFDPIMAMKVALELRDEYRRVARSEAAVYESGPLFLDEDAMAWAWRN